MRQKDITVGERYAQNSSAMYGVDRQVEVVERGLHTSTCPSEKRDGVRVYRIGENGNRISANGPGNIINSREIRCTWADHLQRLAISKAAGVRADDAKRDMQQHVAEQVAQLDYHNITAKADMSGNVGVDMAQVLTALNGAHEPIAHTHVVRVELDGLEFALRGAGSG